MLARELMTSPAVTAGPDWPIRRAIGVLHEHDITALPVLDATGRMAGIVSETADEPAWQVRVRDGVVRLTACTAGADSRIARILVQTVPGVRGVEAPSGPRTSIGY